MVVSIEWDFTNHNETTYSVEVTERQAPNSPIPSAIVMSSFLETITGINPGTITFYFYVQLSGTFTYLFELFGDYNTYTGMGTLSVS